MTSPGTPAPPERDAEGVIPLSVVIPAYNEASRIAPTLEKVLAYLERRGAGFEVIVVDDGSTDGTADVVRRARPDDPRVRLIAPGGNRGKGAAVRSGVEAARGRRVLFSDADLSTPIEDLARLEEGLAGGAAVAIGSRATAGAEVVVRQPWYRQTMGKVFNLFVQAMLLPGIWDSQCGFKLFTARAAHEVFSRQTIPGFSFDVEVLFLALQLGYPVVEVPVHWYNSPASRVHPLLDSSRMFRDLVRIRFRALRGGYDLPRAGGG